jgi:hypothetical protein
LKRENNKKLVSSLLQRLDYLENNGNSNGGGDGPPGNNNDDNSTFDEQGRDWNDPITFYHIFKEEYYFHHSYHEKRYSSIEECIQDKQLHPQCEPHRKGEQGCIETCEFYNMNPTEEDALTAIKAYFPNFPEPEPEPDTR